MTLSQVDSINPPSVTFHKILFHPLSYSIQYINSQHDEFVDRDVPIPSLNIFPDTNGPLNDFDITPNANYYATGGNDGDVFIYNSTRDLILTYSIGSTIKSLAFSMVPQRPKLFVADASGRISILALNCTP
jgi:WD40 repeat protein